MNNDTWGCQIHNMVGNTLAGCPKCNEVKLCPTCKQEIRNDGKVTRCSRCGLKVESGVKLCRFCEEELKKGKK